MRRLARTVLALLAVATVAFGRDTPISGGKLTSDLNANGFAITNLPSGFFPAESDPTVPEWAKNPVPPLQSESDPSFASFTNSGGIMYGPLKLWNSLGGGYDMSTVISSNGVSYWKFNPAPGGGGVWVSGSFGWNDLLTSESDPTVPQWAKSSTKPTYTANEVNALPASTTHVSGDVPASRKVNNKALSTDITLSASDVGAASVSDHNDLSQTVGAWEAYWDGDEVRVTVTNYDSSVNLPSMYLEHKLDGSNEYKVVWSEITRWKTNEVELAKIRQAIDEKADRAWGFYDSHTGNYAPDDYTWISSPKIAIAGGLAYQRTLTVDGAVWVLASNGLVAETGGNAENGFFRIKDDEGNTTFEIVRGNKRTVGATAAGIKVTRSGSSNVVTVPYNVVSEVHPTIYGTVSLSSPEWEAIDADWLGQSGAWTAQVTTASSTYFIKGEYEIGGETYIKNVAPISAEGGIYCTDGIHKVRPVYNNGTITWEVVTP